MSDLYNQDLYRRILEDQVRILAYGGEIEDSLMYEKYCEMTEAEIDQMDAHVSPTLVATRDRLMLEQEINQNG